MPTTHLTQLAATAAGAAMLTTVVNMTYEAITANTYSEQDIKYLNTIKGIYKETLQPASLTPANGYMEFSTPSAWELDGNNKPTIGVKIEYWDNYVKELNGTDKQHGHYNYQAQQIAAYAATYLSERRKRSYFNGKGSAGDLLELVIGEWIHFALTDLRALDYSQIAINKIDRRLNYLERLIKHERLLVYGAIDREKNKFDTLESIKQQLQSCKDIAHEENQRTCAREAFDQCRGHAKALLLACVKFIYFARKTPVDHEPLEVARFINPNNKILSVAAQKIYPAVKKSYSGQMLLEIISRVGLSAFGSRNEVKSNGIDYKYYDSTNKPKEFYFKKGLTDFPLWVKNNEQEEQTKQLQKFGANILSVGELKNLIELAFELTGAAGDLWAYGDPMGKKSLAVLLSLMKSEINAIKVKADSLYRYHDTARQEYNLKYKINANKNANPNFNCIDNIHKEITGLYSLLELNIKTIQTQMQSFPDDMDKKINIRKENFYHSISAYINKNYPEQRAQFNFLQASPNQGLIAENISPGVYVKYSPNDMKFLFEKTEDRYHFINPAIKALVNTKAYNDAKPWRLGQSYARWMATFLTHEKIHVDNHQAMVDKLITDLNSDTTSIASLNQQQIAILENIHQIENKLQREKPQWRFKWSLWPIRTKGWPFNAAARQFAAHVNHDIALIKINITESIQQKTNYLLQESFTNLVKCSLSTPVEPILSQEAQYLQTIAKTNQLLLKLNQNGVLPLSHESTSPRVQPIEVTDLPKQIIVNAATSNSIGRIVKAGEVHTGVIPQMSPLISKDNSTTSSFLSYKPNVAEMFSQWIEDPINNPLVFFANVQDALDALAIIETHCKFKDTDTLLQEIAYDLLDPASSEGSKKQLIAIKMLITINLLDKEAPERPAAVLAFKNFAQKNFLSDGPSQRYTR